MKRSARKPLPSLSFRRSVKTNRSPEKGSMAELLNLLHRAHNVSQVILPLGHGLFLTVELSRAA